MRIFSDTHRLAAYFWAVLGLPPITSLLRALRANLLPSLSMTAHMVAKHPPHTIATAQGHLEAYGQHVLSTHQHHDDEAGNSFTTLTPTTATTKRPDVYCQQLHPRTEIDIDATGCLSIDP